LEDVLNCVEEEHHTIIFLYKSDRQRFGKYITENENEILQKKDPPEDRGRHVESTRGMEKQQ
jgi:hypothetical protein